MNRAGSPQIWCLRLCSPSPRACGDGTGGRRQGDTTTTLGTGGGKVLTLLDELSKITAPTASRPMTASMEWSTT